MKIIKNGDVFIFRCKSCGCVFLEAPTKTDFANASVYVPEYDTQGAWLECPDCGNSVVGIDKNLERNEKIENG